MKMTKQEIIEKLNKEANGGKEIWCNITSDVLNEVMKEMEKKFSEMKIGEKTKSICYSMFLAKMQKKDLTGTIDYETSKAIEYGLIYVANILGFDTDTY